MSQPDIRLRSDKNLSLIYCENSSVSRSNAQKQSETLQIVEPSGRILKKPFSLTVCFKTHSEVKNRQQYPNQYPPSASLDSTPQSGLNSGNTLSPQLQVATPQAHVLPQQDNVAPNAIGKKAPEVDQSPPVNTQQAKSENLLQQVIAHRFLCVRKQPIQHLWQQRGLRFAYKEPPTQKLLHLTVVIGPKGVGKTSLLSTLLMNLPNYNKLFTPNDWSKVHLPEPPREGDEHKDRVEEAKDEARERDDADDITITMYENFTREKQWYAEVRLEDTALVREDIEKQIAANMVTRFLLTRAHTIVYVADNFGETERCHITQLLNTKSQLSSVSTVAIIFNCHKAHGGGGGGGGGDARVSQKLLHAQVERIFAQNNYNLHYNSSRGTFDASYEQKAQFNDFQSYQAQAFAQRKQEISYTVYYHDAERPDFAQQVQNFRNVVSGSAREWCFSTEMENFLKEHFDDYVQGPLPQEVKRVQYQVDFERVRVVFEDKRAHEKAVANIFSNFWNIAHRIEVINLYNTTGACEAGESGVSNLPKAIGGAHAVRSLNVANTQARASQFQQPVGVWHKQNEDLILELSCTCEKSSVVYKRESGIVIARVHVGKQDQKGPQSEVLTQQVPNQAEQPPGSQLLPSTSSDTCLYKFYYHFASDTSEYDSIVGVKKQRLQGQHKNEVRISFNRDSNEISDDESNYANKN